MHEGAHGAICGGMRINAVFRRFGLSKQWTPESAHSCRPWPGWGTSGGIDFCARLPGKQSCIMSRFQRGGPAFTKPENALKRAEELIAVGQPHAALQTLHDVITSKRHRTWQKILETIMFKYVDLCVELKKGRFAKVRCARDPTEAFAGPSTRAPLRRY